MAGFEYRYYLSINGSSRRRIHVHHTGEHERSNQRVSGKRYHRLDISQPFTLGPKGGYHEVQSRSRENEYLVEITEVIDGVERFYFAGKFVKLDCSIDEDNLTLTVKLDPVDQYTKFLEQVDTVQDLEKLGIPKRTIKYEQYPILQVYALYGKTVTNIIDGSVNEAIVESIESSQRMAEDLNFGEIARLQTKAYIPFRDDYPVDVSGNYFAASRTDSGLVRRFERVDGNYILTVENRATWRIITAGGEDVALANGDEILGLIGSGENLPGVISRLRFVADDSIYANASVLDAFYRWSFFSSTQWPTPVDTALSNAEDQFAIGGAYTRTAPAYRSLVPWIGTSNEDQGYGKYPDDGTYPNAGQFISPPGEDTDAMKFYPIGQSLWHDVSWWGVWNSDDIGLSQEHTRLVDLADAYALSDVIGGILAEISPGVAHAALSEFSLLMYGGSNPMTGETRIEHFITAASNIVKFDYTTAGRTSVSLGQILEFLKNAYQADEFIDDEGRFRIEAARFFVNGRSYGGAPRIGADFTVRRNPYSGRPWAMENNKYVYLKEAVPERMIFSWANEVSEVFRGDDIVIKNTFVSKGVTEDRKVTKFVTDLQFSLVKPGAFSGEGTVFMLGCRTDDGIMQVAKSEVPGHGVIQNGALSWRFLQKHYYLDDMPGSRLLINGIEQVAVSTRKVKQQTIAGSLPADFDVLDLLRTGVGAGQVESSIENMESKLSTNTVLHGDD